MPWIRKPAHQRFHEAFLARRWTEGVTAGRSLFAEIRQRGYTGSYSHLARFLAPWRNAAKPLDAAAAVISQHWTMSSQPRLWVQ